MHRFAIVVLRVIIAAALAGSLLVQVMLVPLLVADLAEASVGVVLRSTFAAVVVLEIVAFQASAVCVWMLLNLVGRGKVFSRRAFRYVDIIAGCIAAAALLTFTVAVLLAPGQVAPGVVGLVCGVALVLAGMALVVVVLRYLLRQAIDLDGEARDLQSQLDEVI